VVTPLRTRPAHVPWSVRVVVPARDEAELLPACLTSLQRSVKHLRETRPDVDATVTVVLDRSVDHSADLVAESAGAVGVVVDLGLVGAARAAGVDLATRDDGDPARTWLAHTDADCVVPEEWLVGQLALADQGFEAVVGTVEPHGPELTDALLAAWRARHERRDGHRHVHGANLGLTLAAYRAAGGFPAVATHEDVRLVERLRASGVRWIASGAPPVATSARRAGRAPAGFASYLAGLDPVEPTA
jgi:hypothetical protein